MNSTTNASVEGVVPSLDIIIGTDRLSVDAPGTWWESVGVDPLVVYIVHQLMKNGVGRLQLDRLPLRQSPLKKFTLF